MRDRYNYRTAPKVASWQFCGCPAHEEIRATSVDAASDDFPVRLFRGL
jgi:hypothetical protein